MKWTSSTFTITDSEKSRRADTFKIELEASAFVYLDLNFSNEARFEGKWKVLFLKNFIDLLWLDNQIFQFNVATKHAHIKLVFIETEKKFTKRVFKLVIDFTLEHSASLSRLEGPVNYNYLKKT